MEGNIDRSKFDDILDNYSIYDPSKFDDILEKFQKQQKQLVESEAAHSESSSNKQYLCPNNHEMEYKDSCKYNLFCNKCNGDIVVKDGFYHCEIDEEDYHEGCVNQSDFLD